MMKSIATGALFLMSNPAHPVAIARGARGPFLGQQIGAPQKRRVERDRVHLRARRDELLELGKGGFGGDVYPVNPRYEELGGYRCYPSITEVPGPVDLAVIALANAQLEETLKDCAAAGVGSAVVYASGFEEPRSDAPPLTERLSAIAREAGTSESQLMRYFGGKVGLLQALFEKRLDDAPAAARQLSQELVPERGQPHQLDERLHAGRHLDLRLVGGRQAEGGGHHVA